MIKPDPSSATAFVAITTVSAVCVGTGGHHTPVQPCPCSVKQMRYERYFVASSSTPTHSCCIPINCIASLSPLTIHKVAWATAAGARNSGRTLVEPPGTRGDLTLAACGPDQVNSGVDLGQEARIPRPESLSALTTCAPIAIAGAAEEWRGRLSELMLEFRLAGPDTTAVVGSVGPPPIITMDTTRPSKAASGGGRDPHRGGDREREGGGCTERGGGDGTDGGGDEGDEASWVATRQSEWVEARPGVHMSLISCASPDLASSGFWFWCVASRQATPLNDCAACVSGAPGHRCHLGQMVIDLRPMAIVWNRCSLPLRVMLESAGRGRGGADAAISSLQRDDRNGSAQTETPRDGLTARCGVDNGVAMRTSDTPYAFCLAGSGLTLQPGRRTAVCQQPFVDYRLTIAATGTQVGGTTPEASRPFLVFVPSELLYRSCEARWLPLHERALTENVLSPLVVVASRSSDAHWPSLALRVYPGLSVQNNLPLPVSVISVFSRPVDTQTTGATGEGESHHNLRHNQPASGQMTAAPKADNQDMHPDIPLLRRGGGGGEEGSTSSADGVEGSRGSGSGISDLTSVGRFPRIFRAPAGSLHSAWDIRDSQGDPVPCVLPTVCFEFSLCSEDEETTTTTPAPSSAPAVVAPGSGLTVPVHVQDDGDTLGKGPRVAAAHHTGERMRRSPRLTLKLDSDLSSWSELVLIPCGPAAAAAGSGGRSQQQSLIQRDNNVVLPVIVKLEKETVAGGVALVRLEIHPRVVVHNATNLPMSVSLLGAHHADSCPLWRAHLAPDGRGSHMAVPALPGRRGYYPSKPDVVDKPGSSRKGDAAEGSAARGDLSAGDAGTRKDVKSDGGLRYGLSWLIKSASKAVPARPTGFWADLEVAFACDGDSERETPTAKNASTKDVAYGEAAADGGGKKSIISLLEPSAGAPLHCEPASITVAAEDGRRAARVCVAMETDPHENETSTWSSSLTPTRHLLLYQDPQPILTLCNRAAGPVTVMFDCGTMLEVGPGETVEHSWPEPRDQDRSNSGGAVLAGDVVGGAAKRSLRPPPASPRDQRRGQGFCDTRSHNEDESSLLASPASSPPGSPVSSARRKGGPRLSAGGGIAASGSPAGSSRRLSGNLFGGGDPATLQHRFRCKGGGQGDDSVSWSNPLWVARGVQVIRFDRQVGVVGGERHNSGAGGGDGGPDEEEESGREFHAWDGVGAVGDDDGGGFGVGSEAREVQVHVIERAGGFVMSFAEGGFESVSCAAAGDGAAEGKEGAIAETERYRCESLCLCRVHAFRGGVLCGR